MRARDVHEWLCRGCQSEAGVPGGRNDDYKSVGNIGGAIKVNMWQSVFTQPLIDITCMLEMQFLTLVQPSANMKMN